MARKVKENNLSYITVFFYFSLSSGWFFNQVAQWWYELSNALSGRVWHTRVVWIKVSLVDFKFLRRSDTLT